MTHKLNAILDCTIPACTFTCAAHLREFLFQHHRLQSFLNAAARLIHRSSRHEHVTPLLRDLHWSQQRINFKSVVLVYRRLHGLAPRYLSDHFQRVARDNRRRLRSSSSLLI